MAKVLAAEIRAGNLIECEKRIWRVLKCYHAPANRHPQLSLRSCVS